MWVFKDGQIAPLQLVLVWSSKLSKDKILHNKSSEELLKMLEEMGSTTAETPQVSDETLNFINTYNLLPGNNKVKASLIHKLYNNFVSEKVSQKSCVHFLGQYLPYENGCFLLNVEATKIGTSYYQQQDVKKRDLTKSTKSQAKFNKFLTDFNVSPGGYFVPWYALYFLFQMWCKQNGHKVWINPMSFRRTLNINFTKKQLDNTGPWYGINEKIKGTHLDEQREEQIQKWYERQKNWHQSIRYRLPSTESEEEHS